MDCNWRERSFDYSACCNCMEATKEEGKKAKVNLHFVCLFSLFFFQN